MVVNKSSLLVIRNLWIFEFDCCDEKDVDEDSFDNDWFSEGEGFKCWGFDILVLVGKKNWFIFCF